MFEKEAEEWLERYKFRVFDEGKCNDPNLYAWSALAIKECYIAGAEFGYNKANEWHYVKDGDYPKDNKPVLCILGDIDSENCEVGYYKDVGSGEPWHFETYQLPDDDGDNSWGVSAWKEIVLPKEIKER